jgi:hypothetical protein
LPAVIGGRGKRSLGLSATSLLVCVWVLYHSHTASIRLLISLPDSLTLNVSDELVAIIDGHRTEHARILGSDPVSVYVMQSVETGKQKLVWNLINLLAGHGHFFVCFMRDQAIHYGILPSKHNSSERERDYLSLSSSSPLL